jgi:hypothetical protein
LGVECIGNNVDSEAEWCRKALALGLVMTAKKLSTSSLSESRWNGELKQRRSRLRREMRGQRRSAVTAQAKAQLRKSIWGAKDRM